MSSGIRVVARFVRVIFIVIVVLLLVRFVLTAAGIDMSQPVVAWYYYVTKGIASPFSGLFTWINDGYVGPIHTEWPVLEAAVVYAIIGAVIIGILSAIGRRRR